MNIYESRFGNFARKIELSSTMLYVIGSLARKGQTSVTHREMYILQNVTLMTSTRRGATPEEAYLKSDIVYVEVSAWVPTWKASGAGGT